MKLKTFMIIRTIVTAIGGTLLVVVPILLIGALGLSLAKGKDLDRQL